MPCDGEEPATAVHFLQRDRNGGREERISERKEREVRNWRKKERQKKNNQEKKEREKKKI